jgi:RNA polymerase sigma-70 factor (ECF subfamily)
VAEDLRAWEQSVIRRIAAGDESALAAVYDQYGSLVFGIAQQLVGASCAADVCQEVFIALWERPERFDSARGSLRTFLATIARRRAIDQLRRSGRRTSTEERATHRAPATVPNLEEAAMAMIAAEKLRSAVERLPADQRRAIELAYFEGLTFQQVALATGAAEGTAKSRLRLALERLATALRSDGAIEWA